MKHFTLYLFFSLLIVFFSIQSIQTTLIEQLTSTPEKNTSVFATGLSEILGAIGDNSIAILLPSSDRKRTRKLSEFLKYVHSSLSIQTFLFTNQEKFYSYIETSVKGSVETTSLVFASPESVIPEIIAQNLAHRLSLFLFYSGAKTIDEVGLTERELREPLRAAFITHPRKQVYRVYYNQAVPDGSGKLKMVNWYDANSLGLYKEPLLPRLEVVFKKLDWRTLYVPVIHTPPWLFVNYRSNETHFNNSFYTNLTSFASEFDEEYQEEYKDESNETKIDVTGGRDDALLKVIAEKMQFRVKYIDPPERTQGSVIGNSDVNLTFSGGIGMIQRREADMFLGDIPLSWERRQAVEFTFFTLADSGAFVTHAPRKLSEALVLIRPFLWEVWPILAITVLISAPALYFMIVVPYILEEKYDYYMWHNFSQQKKRTWVDSRATTAEKVDTTTRFYYINEITKDKNGKLGKTQLIQYTGIPKGLFNNVSWFIVNLFLKQSVEFKYQTNRARFLAITIWLGATYVLGDMYSAQLTSQLARPAKESPINTLHKLEYAMRFKNYQLYVEKGSAAQTIIENGTGTFARLHSLMQHQNTYEVNSVEDGIISILTYGSRAILGGRGTLYYNTKLFGTTNFQISEKLYTRYSAIAVQNGCLFLDSLNIILMNLFEAGILDKMTNSEYEKMFGTQIQQETTTTNAEKNDMLSQQEPQDAADVTKIQTKSQESLKLEPISLRMLKGAFFVLLSGHFVAALVLLFEKIEHKHRCFFKAIRRWKRNMRKLKRAWRRINLQQMLHRFS